MVTWRTAAVLEGQWDQVRCLASEWALSKRVGNPFMNYWYKPNVMLSNQLNASAVQVCYYAPVEGGVVDFRLAFCPCE